MRLRIQSIIISAVLLTMLMVSMIAAQTPAGFAQQIFVMTKMMPSVKSIGVISSKITDQFVQAAMRAGLPYGIKVHVARATSPRDIPGLYQSLLKKDITMIWIPDKDDAMMIDLGFEYLREITLENKIGLCVPVSKMVTEGALCSIQMEQNKVTVYINKRVAQVIGADVPSDPTGSIKYILK
jgi:ABC-type uncharacterized transport system substrate-binding protein